MATPDALDVDAPPSSTSSRCTGDPTLMCTNERVTIGGRTVAYQVPLGDAPATGWPTVVYYQGSLIPGERAFAASQDATFGQYELTSTVKALLDAGYAVIAPNALGNGTQYWQSNVPPYATSWTGCADDLFVRALLDAMRGTTFGVLDASRFYAMGISSGGYMTSRMAVSYPGTFRALVVASASYATCGQVCSVPALPADHPPTLFLHGGADNIVPLSTMTPYRDALGGNAESIVNDGAGHEWLVDGIVAIPDWFSR